MIQEAVMHTFSRCASAGCACIAPLRVASSFSLVGAWPRMRGVSCIVASKAPSSATVSVSRMASLSVNHAPLAFSI